MSYSTDENLDWLDFHIDTFSGTPTSTNDIGVTTITVTVTDSGNLSVSSPFTLTVPNRPPTVAGEGLVNRTAYVGISFIYNIEGAFSDLDDPDGGTLSYSTDENLGWLDFHIDTFSGTPTSTNDIGVTTITVTVTDSGNLSVSSTFTLTVPNRPPTISAGLEDQEAFVGVLFSYNISGAFSDLDDPDGGTLSYSTDENLGWLSFNTPTLTFSGTPTSTDDIGVTTITVTVTDSGNLSLSSTFTLTVPNRPPTISAGLEDQEAFVGVLFSYNISGAFSDLDDPDGGTLSYSTDENLGWLSFNTPTLTFSGTPTSTDDIGVTTITVTVTDSGNLSVSSTFTLTVPNRPPTISAGLEDQEAFVGVLFSYNISGAFSDLDDPDGGTLSYSTDENLGWLDFNIDTFSGTPSTVTDIGVTTITVTVTDSGNLSVSSTFTLTVPNRPPTVDEGLTPQTARIGEPFEYEILNNAFIDPDGGTLSYSTDENLGWLDFNIDTFSGTPSTVTDIGVTIITVTVTDSGNLSVSSTFTLTVPNRPPTISAGLEDQEAFVGVLFSYNISGAFSDPDNGTLSYSTDESLGWLSFNTPTLTFSGTPTSTDDIGVTTITVTVTDSGNLSVSDSFILSVLNDLNDLILKIKVFLEGAQ